MAIDPKNPRATSDDPRQAPEEGDPKESGRIRGHVSNAQEETGRTDPDASGKMRQDKQDARATTPHRESGDRA